MSLNTLFDNIFSITLPPGTVLPAGSAIQYPIGPTYPTGPIGPTGCCGSPEAFTQLKYIVKFNKPINIIELFGHIISTTKNRGIGTLLFTNSLKENNDDITDTVAILCLKSGFSGLNDSDIKCTYNITSHTFSDLYKQKDNKEYIAGLMKKLNTTPCVFIDTVLEIIKNWGLDEESIMATMSPTAIAAMLSAGDNSDDDMLNRLESYANECDRKTALIVNHGWEFFY